MAFCKERWFLDTYMSMVTNLRDRLESILGTDGVFLLPGSMSPAVYHHQDIAFPDSLSMTALCSILQLPVTTCPVQLNSQGLPVGVQVVAARGQDRLTLALAMEIQTGLGGWQDPSETT